MASTASRLAWKISIAKIVDIAVVCLIDLAPTVSKVLVQTLSAAAYIGMQLKKIGLCAIDRYKFACSFFPYFQVLHWNGAFSLVG